MNPPPPLQQPGRLGQRSRWRIDRSSSSSVTLLVEGGKRKLLSEVPPLSTSPAAAMVTYELLYKFLFDLV